MKMQTFNALPTVAVATITADMASRAINRLVITAVVTENRPVRNVAAQYGVSQSWLHELLARYRVEGEAAFGPRSQRPASTPSASDEPTPEPASSSWSKTLTPHHRRRHRRASSAS